MVETEVDRRAPLSEACNKPEGYPHSLLTNTTSGAFLAFYETALDQYNKRLCVSSEDPVHIRFWDDSKGKYPHPFRTHLWHIRHDLVFN